MHSKQKANIEFALPEFDTQKIIKWNMHVDSSTKPSETKYDMIIGSDIMSAIGLDVKYSNHTIQWGENSPTIPLKSKHYENEEANTIIYEQHQESKAVKGLTEQVNMLDTDHAKADIESSARQQTHLLLALQRLT